MNQLPIGYLELETIYANTIGAGVRSLAVTSAVAGEGVTTVAEGLARRMEATGQKALLVELNLFHPALSDQFGVVRSSWLPSDVSTGHIAVRDNGFHFLAAPLSQEAPMRFREHMVLQSAIARWLQDYDAVIFDTSPLNALNKGNIPADLVCSVCEGTLLVVLAGRTHDSAVRDALKRLKAVKACLVGMIINDFYNPTLASELLRETERLRRWMPRVAQWLRQCIQNSALLNASV